MAIYNPPKQSGIGQLVDSILILVLVYASLLLPIIMDFGGGEEEVDAAEVIHTWESLGQNATMQAQWEKLGMDVNQAAEIITSRFDYTIEPISLALTAAVVIGYFIFLFKVSDKEYREVLAEKFDEN